MQHSRINEMVAGAVLALCMIAPPALAQDAALPPLAQTLAVQFPAIGRFGPPAFDVTQGCSATLIAPDLVLTAAHCVSTSGSSDRIFAAGWRDGVALAQAGTALETRHPDYGVDGTHTPRTDVALVVLDAPIAGIEPIRLAPIETVITPDAKVALMGYHFRSPDRLVGGFSCSIIPLSAELSRVGCPVINGNSGGPVLTQSEDGTWQVIGVVSSQFRGSAIVVAIPNWLRREIDAHLAG